MARFRSGNVEVDDKFARFGSKSFAINKITSVDVRKEVTPAKQTFALLYAAAAVFLLFALNAALERDVANLPVLVGVALACGFIGYRLQRAARPSTLYRLFLVTSGSETQALSTNDVAYIRDLRASIEDAMAASS